MLMPLLFQEKEGGFKDDVTSNLEHSGYLGTSPSTFIFWLGGKEETSPDDKNAECPLPRY